MPHSLNGHAVKVDVSYGVHIMQKVSGIEIQMLTHLMSDKTTKTNFPTSPKLPFKNILVSLSYCCLSL